MMMHSPEGRKKWGGSVMRVSANSEAAVLLPGSPAGSSSASVRHTSCLACLARPVTVKRCVAALVLLSTLSILYYTHYLGNHPFSR